MQPLVCSYYAKHGRCRYGDKCRNSHGSRAPAKKSLCKKRVPSFVYKFTDDIVGYILSLDEGVRGSIAQAVCIQWNHVANKLFPFKLFFFPDVLEDGFEYGVAFSNARRKIDAVFQLLLNDLRNPKSVSNFGMWHPDMEDHDESYDKLVQQPPTDLNLRSFFETLQRCVEIKDKYILMHYYKAF